jgi:hypothetical protein
MITIIDNFLGQPVYDAVYRLLLGNTFNAVEVGDKVYYVQDSNKEFDNYVLGKLTEVNGGVKLKSLLSFFRVATDELDIDWRIHADSKIGDVIPENALVLYMSPSEMEGLHGVAFWKHKEIGYEMPLDISNEEADRMLLEEADKLENWELSSVVGYRPNRAVSYPANYFHSKYPNKGWKNGRMIYVIFYSKLHEQ